MSRIGTDLNSSVIAGLVPAISIPRHGGALRNGMAGTSPAMTAVPSSATS
jgi:hypothetical protein